MATRKHECRWRGLAEKLEARLAERDAAVAERDAKLAALLSRMSEVEHQLALAHKTIVGPKSEKIPPVADEVKKREGHKPERGGHTNPRKRKENAEAMASLPTTVIPHPVPDAERRCPHCGDDIRPIGAGERSVEYEWVPGRFERRVHVVEVGRCPCKMHYARGPAPARVVEGCKYGAGFLAKLAVDKCGDATPIYRVEKAMRRAGIPLSRSTMNDLILLAGKLCMPLWKAALEEVRLDPHVQADETSFRMQGAPTRSYVWTFLSKLHTVYLLAPTRSGDTPKNVLGGTTGRLTVDGHTGYNVVTEVEGRKRGGCWCHARRHLFDALPSAPEARDGLDIIIDLFLVERQAQARGILGTPAHLALRQERSTTVLAALEQWIERTQPLYEPRSAMGQALGYMNNQWTRLTAFLDDPLVPIHNNASEAALRIVALARKTSLFFGSDEAGRQLLVLYSLIATCERHDVNPQAYLSDVLVRLQDHPKDRVAELLPDRWMHTYGSACTVERRVIPADAT